MMAPSYSDLGASEIPGAVQNAVVETFFKTLKTELVWRTVFQSRAKAKDAIGRYIDGFYNPVRRHSSLDFVSPVQFEKLTRQSPNRSPLN
jgi:putative transposase